MTRRLAILVVAAYAAVLVVVATTRAMTLDLITKSTQHERTTGRGQIAFDGAGPEMWALRWRKQGRLVNTLRRELAARLSRIVYLVDAFQCVHSHEGAWNANTGNGYAGGLQFGSSEWHRYGGSFAARADLASPAEQITAAIAYHADAGFYPWPRTARACGLLP